MNSKNRMWCKVGGKNFTLIELLVVIAIITIPASSKMCSFMASYGNFAIEEVRLLYKTIRVKLKHATCSCNDFAATSAEIAG